MRERGLTRLLQILQHSVVFLSRDSQKRPVVDGLKAATRGS